MSIIFWISLVSLFVFGKYFDDPNKKVRILAFLYFSTLAIIMGYLCLFD